MTNKLCSDKNEGATYLSNQESHLLQNISSDITNNDHSDISDLIKIREQYTNNLVLGYLNINSLKNKIINLREVVDKVLIDILCIDETKLDDTFPDAQFKINNYQYPPF